MIRLSNKTMAYRYVSCICDATKLSGNVKNREKDYIRLSVQ